MAAKPKLGSFRVGDMHFPRLETAIRFSQETGGKLFASCTDAKGKKLRFFFKQGSAANWPDYKNFGSFGGLAVREL